MKIHFFTAVIMLLVVACQKIATDSHAPTPINSTPQKVISTTIKDSISPPKVFKINATNPPKKIKAGQAKVETNPNDFDRGYPLFMQYKNEEDFPIFSFSQLCEDDNGFLWIGTGKGLYRFDGLNFQHFSSLNGTVNDNLSWNLTKDKNGHLWMYNTSGWVFIYDGMYFNPFQYLGGEKLNWVIDILSDREGNVWLGTDNGLLKVEFEEEVQKAKTTRYLMEDGLVDNFINCLEEDGLGNIWIGTNKGVSLFDGHSFSNISTSNGLIDNTINQIYAEDENSVWVLSENALNLYNGTNFQNFTSYTGLPSDHINTILKDQKENIWLGSIDGLHKIKVNKDGSISAQEFSNEELSNFEVTNILEDRNGILWLATDRQGLVKYDPNGPSYFSFDAIAEIDSDANVWFRTEGEGVTKFDGKTFETFTNEQGLGGNFMYDVFQDRSGDIWFMGSNTLTKYDEQFFTQFSAAQGFPSFPTHTIEEDAMGNLWMGSWNSGVVKFDGSQFIHYDKNQGLSNNTGFLLKTDQKGNVWFGGEKVDKFDGSSFVNYDLPLGGFMPYFVDENEDLWLGSFNRDGVIRMNEKEFEHFTINQGLSDNQIFSVVNDTVNHRIWVSTPKGISYLDKSSPQGSGRTFKKVTSFPAAFDLIEKVDAQGSFWGYGDGKILKINSFDSAPEIHDFDVRIQSININNENLAWHLLNDKPFGKNSLAAINQMAIQFDRILSKAEQEEFKQNFKELQFDSIAELPSNLILPFSKNDISFEFTAIDLSYGKDILFQYLLEGYDDDWSPLNKNRQASFGNLKEGNYTFKLKAIHPQGLEKTTSYTFKVLPPWYRTWWAISLFVIAFLSTLWFIRAYELRRQKKKLLIEQQKLEEQRRINEMTSKFVPNAFINALGKKDIMEVKLGDTVEQEVTVLFSDIRNYTSLSEKMTPEENFNFVNAFNQRMGPIIQQQQGFVNQYLGDAVMALFQQSPKDALESAIQMQLSLRAYNKERDLADLAAIKIGIGFHTGLLIMGITGDNKRLDATTISDAVNVASRIENLTKYFGVSILLSEDSYEQIEDKSAFHFRYLGKVIVKGRQQAIKIYECFSGDTNEQIKLKKQSLALFNKGLDEYLSTSFEAAKNSFESVLKINAEDKPALLFKTKAEYYGTNELPQDWNGTEQMV